MNASEYENMERAEARHWYYAGKREFVRAWLERVRPPRKEDVLLDCGAGTGRFAREMAECCDVYVLDDHPEALAMLRRWFAEERILSLAGDQVPLPDASLDYVTALDVLEHTPDDGAVVAGFYRLLKPRGVAVVTVPASMALWSDWDVALHHHRRYSKGELKALFAGEGWVIEQVNYTNVPVYPLVWAVRRWRKWLPKKAEAGSERAEDRVPPKWLNALLKWQFVWLAKRRWPMPFGVSLILVARKVGT